jgi:hypothetical protein
LTLALDGNVLSGLQPGCFTLTEKSSDWIGGWLEPRADLDIVEKRTESVVPAGTKPQLSSPQIVAILTALSQPPFPFLIHYQFFDNIFSLCEEYQSYMQNDNFGNFFQD